MYNVHTPQRLQNESFPAYKERRLQSRCIVNLHTLKGFTALKDALKVQQNKSLKKMFR